MNIPDEVLNAAAVAWWRDYTDEDELDSMSPASAIAVREATEAAAEVIAEWARKETLREAAALADARTKFEAPNARLAVEFVADRIRALAEGAPDGQQ